MAGLIPVDSEVQHTTRSLGRHLAGLCGIKRPWFTPALRCVTTALGSRIPPGTQDLGKAWELTISCSVMVW